MISSAIGSIGQGYKMYLLSLAAILLLAIPVRALRMTDMPKNMQTKIQEPRERSISLKLPLLQPTFHWTFMSRKDLLSGRLLLRIIRDGKSNEIVIFEKGKFSDGWEAMSSRQAPGWGEVYFGFVSTRKYPTAPGDKLELELTVTKDLPGIGALQTGVLPAGTYTCKGSYSGLIDEYDTTFWAQELDKEGKKSASKQEALLNKMREMLEYKAFMESWTDQWPLKITSEKGWLPDGRASALKAMRNRLDPQAEPPAASGDSVATDENIFRKHLWFWMAMPPVVLFAAVFLWRALAKR